MDLKITELSEQEKYQINKQFVDFVNRLDIPKDKKNEFGGFMHRSAEGILAHIKPLLSKINMYVKLTDKIHFFDSNNTYIESTAVCRHTSGYIIDDASAFAREDREHKKMSPAQMTGTASSYARKYALQGLLSLDDGQDADSLSGTAKTGTKGQNKPQNDLPWLNENTKDYDNVVKAIQDGKAKPSDARKKFRVSKAVMAKLEQVIDNSGLVEEIL